MLDWSVGCYLFPLQCFVCEIIMWSQGRKVSIVCLIDSMHGVIMYLGSTSALRRRQTLGRD